MSDTIAAFIRREKARVVDTWQREVLRDIPALHGLSEPVLLDHLYEVLDALADWVEGRTEQAARAFGALIEGHALQRLGFGVGLELVTREYSRLRLVLLREVLPLATDDVQREVMLRLDEGIDRAMSEAIARYSTRREQVRDRFIGILGHDLRDPLASISLAADRLVADPGIAPEHRTLAERIERGSGRMERMISDLLDFARGHLGEGIPATPQPADLGAICRAVADEFSTQPSRGTVTVSTEGDLRGAFDRDRVAQALTNLVRNGLQHGAGAVQLRAWEAEDKEALFTAVSNTGPEIPEDARRRLFGAFTGTRSRDGLGLGLYIVQQIALAHGGLCEVSSSAQQTTFTIRWPRSRARIGQPHLGVER